MNDRTRHASETHSNAGLTLEATQDGSDATSGHTAARPLAPGAELGGYQIFEALGAGGMGAVYRARPSSGGAEVALKTVIASRASLLPRIRREIQALARLEHPGIVRIVAFGEHDGLPWYAMELVGGVELREAGVGPLRERLTLARRLCSALAYLHGEGLVHRDVKPANVVVRPDGWPVLVDFGLAFETTGAEGREVLGSEFGFAGTPAYMAPEQIRGELLDARADLYSLGVLMFELFTGQRPFAGLPNSQLMQAHLRELPRLPPELPEGWPPALEALLLRLLAKNPRARIGYADDVARALVELGAEDIAETRPPRAYLYRPLFAGRADALEAFHAALAGLARGEGGCILVGGESGIGKTRLVREAARLAGLSNVEVLTGECRPPGAEHAGEALHPLRSLLQAIADRCLERGAAETERLLGERLKLLAPFEPGFSGLATLAPHPEPTRLAWAEALPRLHEALRATLAAFARQAEPLFLVLDDLQWADELTLGFLEFLLQLQGRLPPYLLLVGTYRREEVGAALSRLLGADSVRRVDLGRLEQDAVGSIVRDMLALAAPPASLVSFLAERSEGNPFFVAEYLRAAVAEGLLYRLDGVWQVAEPGGDAATKEQYEALSLPRSLRSLVARRLDGLSPEARHAAELASVFGREVEEQVLHEACASERFTAAIEELRLRQVLEDAKDDRLRFLHDQLREVAYERISAGRRPALHRAVAEALGGSAGRSDAAIGQHWLEAGEPELARRHFLAAAEQARARYDHFDAVRLYREALALQAGTEPESMKARLELAETLEVHGQLKESLREYERLELDATEASQLPMQARAKSRRAFLMDRLGHPTEAEASIRGALELAIRLGSQRQECESLNVLAGILQSLGRLDEAQSAYLRILSLSRRQGDAVNEGVYLANLGGLFLNRGRVWVARSCYEQALQLFVRAKNQRFQAHARLNLGGLFAAVGRFEEAEEHFRLSWSLLEALGDRFWQCVHGLHRGQALRRAGRWSEARACLERAERGFLEQGAASTLLECRQELGFTAIAAGDFESARRLSQELGAGGNALSEALAIAEGKAGRLHQGQPWELLPQEMAEWLDISGLGG